MEEKYFLKISKEHNISVKQVKNTLNLLAEGATIPFISRYRKELTGQLDEVQISDINELNQKYIELEKRREAILQAIEKLDKLTDELKSQILKAETINELEDLYLPYKQKRKTRALKAKEKGLEPLANLIFDEKNIDLDLKAEEFLTDEVLNVEDALQGARDIIAEKINEDQRVRNITRQVFENKAIMNSSVVKAKEVEAEKYQDYFDWNEDISKIPSHRVLAMFRGETEGFLKLNIFPPAEELIYKLEKYFVKANNESSNQLKMAINDSYSRLLKPSIETEFRNLIKEKADLEAIKVFAKNLRQLLLSSPLGEKRVLAIDPGFKSGCKLVCLDQQGNLLHNETIYPHPPQNETIQAAKKIKHLVNSYKIEAIAIGNGTAGRETEDFIRRAVKFENDVQVFVVNESGASIYSASKIARDEFPDFDVTVRGSVSIGRRLIDPLAELIKIDPKSIGVGQYQHDVDQNKLQQELDSVVASCVNSVGVDLNTSSKQLLTYVSGLGPQLAQNIIDYRSENGAFKSRKELLKVKRMGAKAFEQAAGFLRIRNAKNILDNTAVHPESYFVVKKMAEDLKTTVDNLVIDSELRKKINLNSYVTEKIGLPTLKDIFLEIEKPGRDPRTKIKVFKFAQGVNKIEHVIEGAILPGIVTNITNFGAFVDIGVKQDGLVHISELKDEYISNPSDVVSLNQHVKVIVLSVDIQRKRIQLSMKESRMV
ncbi:MAG: RNA-binding transcriptional accessory protein [Bacteroidales bacterium]|nr:RNA-binding transcriptional accessory protein [Bacteroidales bacterium]MBN2756279.1 RNA-binding transcriptional accessory protein [Bacteroidales bacterium]